jgi:hypothetical protein
MVKSLGADRVIDYTKENFTRLADRYDLMLDCICNHSLAARRRVLTRTGRLVVIGAPPGRTFVGMLAAILTPLVVSPFVGQKLTVFMARAGQADLALLGDLMARGVLTPVIARREGLNAVHRRFDVATRHARGKVVVALARFAGTRAFSSSNQLRTTRYSAGGALDSGTIAIRNRLFTGGVAMKVVSVTDIWRHAGGTSGVPMVSEPPEGVTATENTFRFER